MMFAAALLAALTACSPTPGTHTLEDALPSAIAFEDVTESAGIGFLHDHGGSGTRYLVETMGSGGGFVDFDGDGWLDIYLLQGKPLPGHKEFAVTDDAHHWSSRLYRNRGDGSFEDVTATSGTGDVGYGMGTCFGDIDNDGHIDIHVTAFGPDRLLRNRGDGTFQDATESSGIDNPKWGASCAFADYDADGCLDLYVTNYLDSTTDNHVRCGPSDHPQYCHPDVFKGVPDLLYRNQCDGTFKEVGAQAATRIDDPAESKGLGVVWLDYDDDGDPDIYVANDSTRNFLFRNEGDGRFTEVGVLAGAAFNEHGRTEAGMGIAAGDLNADGRLDLVVTHLDFETNTLYRNIGGGLFEDASIASGIAAPSITRVGFGIVAFDPDNDGDLDLAIANGHILDNIAQLNPSLSHAQGDQLLQNDGSGRFAELKNPHDAFGSGPHAVGRAAAAGDFDNDGLVDLLITNSGGKPRLLRNRSTGSGNWMALRLLSRHGGRDAVGARVRLVSGDLTLTAEVRAGSSYLAQEDQRLHFGLGTHESIDELQVRWPEGDIQSVPVSELALGRLNVIRQFETPSGGAK